MPATTEQPSRCNERGFTMIEVMVVILVLGVLARIVVSNSGAWIPESAVSSEAGRFRTWIDYLRSEAKIQGKSYTLELDLKKHRTRLLLPPEDKLAETEEDTIAEVIPMGWNPLDKRVRFHGHGVAGGEIYTNKTVKIVFDENGFTADQAVFFRYNQEDSRLVWTVQIRGLSGASRVIPDYNGKRHPLQLIEEANF